MSPLRKKLLNDMTVRGMSENTKKLYDRSVSGLVRYHRRSPDTISKQEVQDYLLYLIEERKLRWKSVNVYVHGIRFFYRITLDRPEPYFYVPTAKQESKLPVLLNRDQIAKLFNAATNPKHRAILITAYAAGLRVSELTNLRVKDIDSQRIYWRQMKVKPTEWLFPGQCADGRLSIAGIARIYSSIKAKAGITTEGGIHTLRHYLGYFFMSGSLHHLC